MKKFTSIFFVFVLLLQLSVPGITASAEVVSYDNNTLNSWFLDGQCPGELDYVYYAPETQADTKYPLVVWLHGSNSGTYARKQLEEYQFSNWASPEYQARFKNAGGAFLLAPRSSKDPAHNWYATSCSSVKKTIDYFISLYGDKIDTERIYISGYSTGGSLVWNMVTKYPGFFAAAMPIASIYNPTSAELNELSDIAVWMFNCEKDFYASAKTSMARSSFNTLQEITASPTSVRLTSFSQSINPDNTKLSKLEKEHYIWIAVTNDMFMDTNEQYYYTKTIDATGSEITFKHPDGVISWLSEQRSASYSNDDTDEQNFFQKIIAFFTDLFNKILAFFNF